MNSDPAAAHLELRQAVREFATAVIKPLAPRTDREHRYPREALDAAAELDLMGILVFARTNAQLPGAAGVSCFIVPGDAPGLKVGQVFDKMGLNGSPTGELVLEEVRVPAANLLHEEGKGFTVAMRALDSGRIGISAQALGIGQAALNEALAYTRDREQFDRPIASFQGVGWMLAEMATRLEAWRRLGYHAADLSSRGLPFTKEP